MTSQFRQLLLYPVESQWVPVNFEQLESTLQAIGLIGETFHSGCESGKQYLIGDAFLQHINFMGCAPAVAFAPDDSATLDLESFTYIHLINSYQQPRWFADLKMAKPACPNCKKRTAGVSSHFEKDTGKICCPHCQTCHAADQFDWKEFGGVARTFVSIVNAYPKETIPSGNLLAQLKQRTQQEWRYFYYHGALLS